MPTFNTPISAQVYIDGSFPILGVLPSGNGMGLFL